jgi:small subunit ribosomal protein S17
MENKEITMKQSKAPTHKGLVVSDKMDKTIVVKVDTLKAHAKYKKRYISSKRYKVHDAENAYHEGDVVSFRECKPYSKDKKHVVVSE